MLKKNAINNFKFALQKDGKEREELIQALFGGEDECCKLADELMIVALLYANGKMTTEQCQQLEQLIEITQPPLILTN